jgi:hypothetical protein
MHLTQRELLFFLAALGTVSLSCHLFLFKWLGLSRAG